MTDKARAAILISGRGSNMAALIDAARTEDYPARIVGVISNKASAPGLALAAAEGIPTEVIALGDHADKLAADMAIDAQLKAWGVDIVCLAGFMRLLTPELCDKWLGRMINIHPSLLPEFPGLDTHRRALEAEVGEHGCSVHFVTAEMDAGPIIGQVAVPVEYGDTEERLAERVLKAEHKLYPWALAQVASGTIALETQPRRKAPRHH
jgi:formyltetrahydrofolate-dependent phosphoribosylglycinamide formyltransferase